MKEDNIIEIYNKGKKRFYLEKLKTLLIILAIHIIFITFMNILVIGFSIFNIIYENMSTILSLIIIIEGTVYFAIVPDQWNDVEEKYKSIKSKQQQ